MSPSSNTQMMPLEYLLDFIQIGSMAVPDFQRPFVWSNQQITSLLGTVLNGWPSGSLLMLRGDTHLFRTRELSDTPRTADIEFVVLDGQQRLTALYWALRDGGPTVFALDLSDDEGEEISDAETLENQIRTIDRLEWDAEYSTPGQQAAHQLMPISALASPSDFFAWRDEVARTMSNTREAEFVESSTHLYRNTLSAVHRYSFPVVTLEGQPNVAAIARIFEKVNRSGTVLGTFDLMVARVYEPGWNLRTKWQDLREDEPIVPFLMGTDGMPLLDALSLRLNGDVRRRAVLELEPGVVHDHWERMEDAVVQAAERLTGRYGVEDSAWLPYRVQLVALAALMADDAVAGRDEMIDQWFWSRSFALGYDVAANTRIVSDFNALRRGNFESAQGRPSLSETVVVGGTRRTHRAFFSSFLCLLATRSTTDLGGAQFKRHDSISVDAGPDNVAQARYVASMFPKGLDVGRYESAPHLRTLSMIFVSRETRRLLRRGGIEAVVRVLRDGVDTSSLDDTLATYYLPPSETLLSFQGDWRAILAYRAERLGAELNQRWGVLVERPESHRDSRSS